MIRNTLPTVHVVDPDPRARAALERLLRETGLRVVGYPDGIALLEVFKTCWRGCVLADLHGPVIGGAALMERLVARGSHMPVILLAAGASVRAAVRAVQAGAFDFIEKPWDEQGLLERVQAALELEELRYPERLRLEALHARLLQLSARERQVMDLVALQGLQNKQIAERLRISVNTVEVHRANLMRKLEVGSAAELLRFAVAAGLVTARSELGETERRVWPVDAPERRAHWG